MTIKNKMHGTEPILFHASGGLQFNPLWGGVQSWSKMTRSQYKPSDLSIITFNNQSEGHNLKRPGTFESSLKGIPVSVLGFDIVVWRNSLKIELLKNHIDSVKTNYVLVSDSSDVVLAGDLGKLLPRFKRTGTKALFNSEKLLWPQDLPADILEFNQSRTDYLNAGLWVARTEFAKEIVEFCSGLTHQSNSEQYYYQIAYEKFYPEISVDATCALFQNLNRTTTEELHVPRLFI